MNHPFAVPIILILLVVACLYGMVMTTGIVKTIFILVGLAAFIGTAWYLTPKKKKKKKK